MSKTNQHDLERGDPVRVKEQSWGTMDGEKGYVHQVINGPSAWDVEVHFPARDGRFEYMKFNRRELKKLLVSPPCQTQSE